MNPIWMLRLVQLHFRITPLGIPQEIDEESVVAVTAAFDARTLARLRSVRGDSRPAIVAQPIAERRMRA
jgi:acyl-homoserine lactone synthase